MTIDDLQDYVVCLEGGSGCLFQPMSEEACTYILTAKHIFINKEKVLLADEIRIRATRSNQGSREEYFIPFGHLIPGDNYFPHPQKDIAILKIPKQEGLECLFRTDDFSQDRLGFILAGYPHNRRQDERGFLHWYRSNEPVTVKEMKGEYREASVAGHPDRQEIIGQSGGGILKLKGENILLAGVQNRMVSLVEQLGNIEFSPLSSFDEIIELYPGKLAQLYAPHLRCFSYLRDHIFDLRAGFGQEDVAYTKEYLKAKTVQIVNSKTTPYYIKNFFQSKLLIHKQPIEVLQSRNIWIAWLEFLIILNVVKDKAYTEEEMEDVFNSYRLLYSNTQEDWSAELPNIIYSDYRGLRENGLVVIGTPNPPHANGYVLQHKIPQIARVAKQSDRSLLKIDDGINFPLDKYRFIHLDYFKNGAISNKSGEYSEIDSDEVVLAKLKSEYEQLFRND